MPSLSRFFPILPVRISHPTVYLNRETDRSSLKKQVISEGPRLEVRDFTPFLERMELSSPRSQALAHEAHLSEQKLKLQRNNDLTYSEGAGKATSLCCTGVSLYGGYFTYIILHRNFIRSVDVR